MLFSASAGDSRSTRSLRAGRGAAEESRSSAPSPRKGAVLFSPRAGKPRSVQLITLFPCRVRRCHTVPHPACAGNHALPALSARGSRALPTLPAREVALFRTVTLLARMAALV